MLFPECRTYQQGERTRGICQEEVAKAGKHRAPGSQMAGKVPRMPAFPAPQGWDCMLCPLSWRTSARTGLLPGEAVWRKDLEGGKNTGQREGRQRGHGGIKSYVVSRSLLYWNCSSQELSSLWHLRSCQGDGLSLCTNSQAWNRYPQIPILFSSISSSLPQCALGPRMPATKFLAPMTPQMLQTLPSSCPWGPTGPAGMITAAVPTQVIVQIRPLLFTEHCPGHFILWSSSHSPLRKSLLLLGKENCCSQAKILKLLKV